MSKTLPAGTLGKAQIRARCKSFISVAGVDGMGVRLWRKHLLSRGLNAYEGRLDSAAIVEKAFLPTAATGQLKPQ